MFSKAIAEAKEFTRPIVILYRMTDGRVESIVGTFVHVDDDGHILSASHIFKMGSEDPISTVQVIFDGRSFSADYIADDVPNDIILLRIRDYKPGSIKAFPKFLDGSTGELPRGVPLVRLGYPMGSPHSNVRASWDDMKNCFCLDGEAQVSSYFNEGIVTQYVVRDKDVRLMELTSPALIGQSGGPVLTTEGIVVGLQSRNTLRELPNKPPFETGLATSHIAIARFLEKHLPCERKRGAMRSKIQEI